VAQGAVPQWWKLNQRKCVWPLTETRMTKPSYRDPKTDEPVIVGKALASLYLALKAEGFKVVIENWPTEDGKGIDDARRTP
jgi:hypothetical protein